MLVSAVVAVLSIGRLGASGGADYYLDKVANNVDDYYLGRGEAPGRWIGATSEQLGLFGHVEAEALRNLLAGNAADGQSLGVQVQPGRRPGYDLTFSAPKGISLLWAFGSGEVPDAIAAAHDRAVGAVLDHLSQDACYARRGHGGTELIEGRGFIGAAFRHRTSRAGDPQLHTHVVVPNLIQASDGRWSAPDGRHLFAWKMTAGTLYRSALRAELAPLGLAWELRRNGLSELRDVPKPILRAFSKRRADIEAAMQVRGTTSQRAAETAALDTRARKPTSSTRVDILRQAWAEQLGAIELANEAGGVRAAGAGDITAVLGAEVATGLGDIDPSSAEIEEVFAVLAGENGVTIDDYEIDEDRLSASGLAVPRSMPVTLLRSTFTRRDAMGALARAFDVTPRQASVLTATFLERQGIIRVLADPDAGPEHIRTRRGHLVNATSGDRRYTTAELLATERRIVASALDRINTASASVAPEGVERVLAAHAHLDGEQADGVRALLTSGNGYDVVIGQAGTGKTTMLAAARAGWEGAGFSVVGTAVAARTAADLEAGTGIPSSSLSALLADISESGGLSARHVVVLDEASMVGSRPLDRLRSYVDAASAKLVLLGDNRQLSSIDAGGALRTLATEMGDHVVTLSVNRRQGGSEQQWERDALVALRHGDVAPALDAYVEHGRVAITDSIERARQRIVEDWWRVHETHTTAILAVRRSDVAALNEMVRERRRDAGELGTEITVGTKAFSVGDRVIFEKNQRVHSADPMTNRPQHERVKLRNGTFGTVVGFADPTETALSWEGDTRRVQGDVASDLTEAGRSQNRRSLVVHLDDGRRAVLPPSYAETSTSLGYALTVFRSQGITVDHTFALAGDNLYQEAGYTALSRGRISNNLYTASLENPRWEIGHQADDFAQRDALGSLVDALSKNQEQTMARDRLAIWPSWSPDDVAAAYREQATLSRWVAASVRTTDVDAEAWLRRQSGVIERWQSIENELRRHEYGLGQGAAYNRPEHIVAFLGPLPEGLSAVERWQAAAGAVEAYRMRWQVDTADPLGPEPLDGDRRIHRHRAAAAVASARSGATVSGGAALDSEWVSALWDRVAALDGERSEPDSDVAQWWEPLQFAWDRASDIPEDLDDIGMGF